MFYCLLISNVLWRKTYKKDWEKKDPKKKNNDENNLILDQKFNYLSLDSFLLFMFLDFWL